MITIACVLRSGGDFGPRDVRQLVSCVSRQVTVDYQFVCLTDIPANELPDGVQRKELMYSWPGWWSKIEIFGLRGPVLYLDLDTIVVGSIDKLINAVRLLDSTSVMMLRGFRHKDWASGIIGWSGNLDWMIEKFLMLIARHGCNFFYHANALRLNINGRTYRGDQDWIAPELRLAAHRIIAVQDLWPGAYSYKNDVKDNGLPADAKLVCFHGRPRPVEVFHLEPWIRKAWATC